MAVKLMAPPVSGRCGWLKDRPCGRRVLAINGTPYQVEHGWNEFKLYRFEDGLRLVVYTIKTDGIAWQCDCPDATHRDRPGGCKHAKALRAAVARRPY